MDPGSKNYHGLIRLRDRGFAPQGILDIGAYNGDWATGARSIFPSTYILMIDALAERLPMLQATRDRIGNADYEIALLGGVDTVRASFYVVHSVHGQTGSSRYEENTGYEKERRSLPQRSLSSLLADKPARRFDFLKLDVQGAELDVLVGLGQHLSEVQAVQLEIATLEFNRGAPLAAEVISFMDQRGFVLFDLLDEIRLGSGLLFQFDALFLRSSSACRPKPPF